MAEKNRFNGRFNDTAFAGDAISAEVGRLTVTATIVHDVDSHIDDDDTHNSDQGVTGCTDAQQQKLLAARRAWHAGEWFYCGVVLSVWCRGIELGDSAASLWGVESNYPDATNGNDYLTEVANELFDEAVAFGNDCLKVLASAYAEN